MLDSIRTVAADLDPTGRAQYGSRMWRTVRIATVFCAVVLASCDRSSPEPTPDTYPSATLDDQICCADTTRAILRFDDEPSSVLPSFGSYRSERSEEWGTYAWLQRESAFYLPRPHGDEFDFVAECAPFQFEGAPPQTATVSLNDEPLGSARLEPKWNRIRLPIPSLGFRPAVNELRVEFAYAEKPSDVSGTEDVRKLAAVCRYLGVAPRGERDVTPRVEYDSGTHTLTLSSGGRTTLPLPASPRVRLTLGAIAGDLERPLELTTRTGDGVEEVVWEGPAGEASALRLDIERATGSTAELGIQFGSGEPHERDAAVQIRLPDQPLSALEADAPAGRADQPDIFIYMMDTLRADALGAYGADPSPSPRIDQFAADGVVYQRAWTTAPWTLPATESILTGLHASQHGSTKGAVAHASSHHPDGLGKWLASQGYETLFITQTRVASRYFGLGTDFDRSYLHDQIGIDRQTSSRVRWFLWRHLLASNAAPLFLYLHTIDPHHPYIAVGEDARFVAQKPGGADAAEKLFLVDRPGAVHDPADLELYRARYYGDIAYADRQFGAFVDLLKDQGRYESSLILLVSDHGEEFGEHGGLYHSRTLFEELLHVPLIVKYPGGWKAGERVRERVSNVDVPATVHDVLGLAPASFDGVSLRAPLTAEVEQTNQRVVFAEASPEGLKERYAAVRLTAAARGDLKCVWSDNETDRFFRPIPAVRAFDLSRDSAERAPLDASPECADLKREWQKRSADRRYAPNAAEEVGEDTRQKLRALGYLD